MPAVGIGRYGKAMTRFSLPLLILPLAFGLGCGGQDEKDDTLSTTGGLSTGGDMVGSGGVSTGGVATGGVTPLGGGPTGGLTGGTLTGGAGPGSGGMGPGSGGVGPGSGGVGPGSGGFTPGSGGMGPGSGGLGSGGVSTGGLGPATGGMGPSGGAETGGAETGSAETGGAETGGQGQTVSYDCALPPAGEAGKPRPSGATANLKVLDWAGFSSAISYTFDDSNSSQISHYDEMNSWGVKYTFYLQTGKQESNNAVWQQALEDGHELGNHTQNHTCGASDIQSGASFIQQKFGITPLTLAAPNGDQGCQGAAGGKYFLIRSVSGGTISPNGNTDLTWAPSNIPGGLGATQGKWQIYCIHGFTGGSDGAYQPIGFDSFKNAVQQAKAGGSWIDSALKIGAYWAGQKAFPKNGTTSWTWQLPANFPEGQCLRVTVDGGTLSQDDGPLAWDDHGYYEISLDAGSLTWTAD